MHFLSIILSIAAVSWLTACNDMAILNSDLATKPTVIDLNKAMAQPGDTIAVEGLRLTEKIKVLVGGENIKLNVDTSNGASFVIPSTLESGLADVEFSYNGDIIKKLPLMIGDADNVKNIAAESICDDTIFRDADGEVARGKRNCRAEAKSSELCSKDGQVDCLASVEFPAVDKVNVLDSQTAKFLSSLTIAGVKGELQNCSEDGEENCLTDGVDYRAAKLSGFTESDIRDGLSVAGVTGSMPDSNLRSCASDGDISCLANAAFPAVDKTGVLQANAAKIRSDLTIAGVSGALNDCSADGATGCVAVGPSYAAADVAGAAAKILVGQSLGGIAGTAPARPSECSSDGGTDCVAVTAFPAMKLAGAAAKIAQGDSLAGVAGTAAVRPSDCAADGATGCVAVSAYPAIDKTALTSNTGKIRSSLTLASVAGTLDDCSADGGTACVAVASYPAATAAGAASKILTGQTLAGISGSAAGRPADCAADGDTNCVAITNFPAVDKLTNLAAGNLAKIHSSVSVAGLSGTMSDCSSDGGTSCMAVAAYPAANATGAAAKILTGQTLAGINGSASGRPADCASDGSTNCVAVASYPSVDKSALTANASKIRSSLTLASVTGTLGDCAIDGDSNCVAVAAYPAALAAGAAGKILSGQTLAGVNGSASGRPLDCAADGATNCVAVSNYPAIDKAALTSNAAKIRSSVTLASVSGTLADCSSDGEAGCVAVGPSYAAAVIAGAGAKILTGQSVAGVNGSADVKPSDCAADGATDCVAVAGFPAADVSGAAPKIVLGQSLAGISGSASGVRPSDCGLDGESNCVAVTAFPAMKVAGAAAKIALGDTLAGVAGTAAARPSDCAADGATGCVAVANYPSVDKSALTTHAAKIRSSVTLASVTGTLADCGADGDTNCVAIASYPAALASGAASKILTGQTLAGVNGTAAGRPSDCAADGATGCVAVTNYPSVDKSALSTNAGKVRSGTSIAGVSGSLADCSADGSTGCVAVTGFPSANATGAAAKILTGQTLAGVGGSAAIKPADCTADGATGCVAVASYPSVDKSALTANAAKIRSSLSIASVTGSLADCANDGEAGCVVVGPTYAAALITGAPAKILTGQTLAGVNGTAAGRPSDCSSDGATNCVAVAGFPAANTTGAAAKILTGQTLAAVSGSAAVKPADCSADGATNCVTVTDYPSVDKSALTTNAGKVRSGTSIAGVSGSLADCSADGGTGCVAVSGYPAANATGAAAKILTGQSLAGVNGTAAVKPADCAADGVSGCVTVSNYPSVDKTALTSNASKVRSGTSIAGVAGSLADCAADGGTGCVAVTAYPAALASGAAAKILTGQTLAGISGSAAIRPSDCSSDGGTNCVAVTNFPAVDKVNGITGNAGKIRSSVTIAGVTGTLADCSSDNGTDCVAVTNYPSVVKANVTVGVIKSGTVIAGVSGVYPNSTYPLTVADGYNDLDTATFNAKIKTSANFGWFDRNGTRHSTTGDTDISAGNIKSGVDIFGATGTFGAPCSGDGQTSCLTTSTYKSADTSAYTAWDIRSDKTVGGIAGSLVFYKNMIGTFNRTTGAGALAGTDAYDTIEDYNNNGAFPTTAPSAWTIAPGSNWLRDPVSDTGLPTGTASNGACDGTEACVYKDQTTGLYWAKEDATSRNWETAITYCDGLSYGDYSDWRLPTQKELYMAYIDGIWGQKTPLSISTGYYWTSTTLSTDTTAAWSVVLYPGYVNYYFKTNTLRVVCVR